MPPSSLDKALMSAARAHRKRAAEVLAPLGLHPGQELLLSILAKRGGTTQAQLARILGVEPPTIAKMVGRLEAGGFAERAADERDARAKRVALTAQGAAVAAQIEEVWASLSKETTADLTEDEQRTLARLLTRVTQSLTQRST